MKSHHKCMSFMIAQERRKKQLEELNKKNTVAYNLYVLKDIFNLELS